MKRQHVKLVAVLKDGHERQWHVSVPDANGIVVAALVRTTMGGIGGSISAVGKMPLGLRPGSRLLVGSHDLGRIESVKNPRFTDRPLPDDWTET